MLPVQRDKKQGFGFTSRHFLEERPHAQEPWLCECADKERLSCWYCLGAWRSTYRGTMARLSKAPKWSPRLTSPPSLRSFCLFIFNFLAQEDKRVSRKIWTKNIHKNIKICLGRGENTKYKMLCTKGEEKGVGWTGSLGLIAADYCLWNGWAMRSCCVSTGNYVWSLMMEQDHVRK